MARRVEWEGVTWWGEPEDAGNPSACVWIHGHDTGVQGLLGGPGVTNIDGIQRHIGDGVAGSRHQSTVRTITFPLLMTLAEELAWQVSGSLAVRPDPVDVAPLVFREFGPTGQDIQVWARPLGAEASITVIEAGVKSVWRLGSVQFQADDPVIYTATPTVESRSASGSHSFVASNAGTCETRNGRAWTLEFTASGSVTNPWIEIEGQRVVFPTVMSTGQVLTVTTDRQTYIGSSRISGLPSTPGESAPNWPTLTPGDNDVSFGADAGSFAAEFSWRSTWL